MKLTEEQLIKAGEAFDKARVPTDFRFYIDEEGNEYETQPYKPTIGSLFPCLKGQYE